MDILFRRSYRSRSGTGSRAGMSGDGGLGSEAEGMAL